MAGFSGEMINRASGILRNMGLLGTDDDQQKEAVENEVHRGLLGMDVTQSRMSSPDSRWGEDPAEIEARLRGANSGWQVGNGGSAQDGARGMMPGLSQGGRMVAGGQRPDVSPAMSADSRWGDDPATIEATLRGRNAGWQVDQTGRGQDGSRGMMPGLSPGGQIAAAGKTVLDYASQGGPFRSGGPLESVTRNIGEGLVNAPRAMGFNGDPTNDINRFASMAPTPMAGMNGPRMAGAGVGGAAAAPISMRAAPPPGMIQEQSRLDDKGDQWMVDPASGAEINLSEMERSTARYMEDGAGFSTRPDDLAGKVAQHVRNTSANVRELGTMMRDMEPGYDMMQDIEPGYRNGAQSYLPEGAEAYVQGNNIRFVDPNPGDEFYRQMAARNGGSNVSPLQPLRRPAPAPVHPNYANWESQPVISEAADMIWSPPRK